MALQTQKAPVPAQLWVCSRGRWNLQSWVKAKLQTDMIQIFSFWYFPELIISYKPVIRPVGIKMGDCLSE